MSWRTTESITPSSTRGCRRAGVFNEGPSWVDSTHRPRLDQEPDAEERAELPLHRVAQSFAQHVVRAEERRQDVGQAQRQHAEAKAHHHARLASPYHEGSKPA